ncbi:putative HNH endonuclease [Mycobacterium phage HC]|uniref:Putative HNH endonuclease n=1 Tax=Mycobacterium phage HC TaxID=2077135 RepID=A0A2Z5XVR9_9CAUD|nr:HNH endonuclease [Mycobacterium phage HC]WRQ08747.1 putative HNH endonuclease [Mycobacterium phage mika]BBC53952.1 putative HNH endonuclease [Mycobacterium phage HC]
MPKNGSTSARGYGWKHQALRAQVKPYVEAGHVDCWRCGERIQPGQQWDLGHDDDDRSRYRGPEHALAKDCAAGGNRATAGRRKPPPALGFFDTTRP